MQMMYYKFYNELRIPLLEEYHQSNLVYCLTYQVFFWHKVIKLLLLGVNCGVHPTR